MKKAIVCLLIITLGILLKSCNTTEPPPPPDGEKSTLTLKLEDVSCIEAWITLKTTNLQLPATVELKQFNPNGDTLSEILILNTQDSLLYIDSLMPNKTYQYQVSSNQHQISSNELSVTTLDTTSHNFTFQSWTFGTIGSSTLYDVAIIDENNIWAVGEIYMNDSLGQTIRYNAVHWDGTNWELKRIYYYGSCSAVEYPPLKAIWAFSENNIAITNGGSIGWFNGNIVSLDCGVNPLLTGAINKIYGSSNNDLYVAGNEGNIAHYDRTSWTKIESGTTKDLKDIYGFEDNVWIVGYDLTGSIILKVTNHNITKTFEYPLNNDLGIDGLLEAVWLPSKNSFYTISSFDLYRGDENLSREFKSIYGKGDGFQGGYLSTRGTDHNDIITAGYNGSLNHFNGVSWFRYVDHLYGNNLLNGVEINSEITAAVGEVRINMIEYKALIILGTKN